VAWGDGRNGDGRLARILAIHPSLPELKQGKTNSCMMGVGAGNLRDNVRRVLKTGKRQGKASHERQDHRGDTRGKGTQKIKVNVAVSKMETQGHLFEKTASQGKNDQSGRQKRDVSKKMADRVSHTTHQSGGKMDEA